MRLIIERMKSNIMQKKTDELTNAHHWSGTEIRFTEGIDTRILAASFGLIHIRLVIV